MCATSYDQRAQIKSGSRTRKLIGCSWACQRRNPGAGDIQLYLFIQVLYHKFAQSPYSHADEAL